MRCREIRNSDRCIFLVAGRLIYRKGLNFLFDVLERLPDDLDYQCRIVGSGTEYDTLKRRCSSSTKLEQHVVFIKKIPFNEMGKEYNNASVLIMPSIRETTGSVLLEAMAYGVPVITINAFGGKVIIDEETGWLYSGTSKEDYLNSLSSVITDCVVHPDEVLRKAINAQCESRKFTWEEKVRKYNDIYSNLLEEADSPS